MSFILARDNTAYLADSVSEQPVDLSNCDREPIQYIEAIQPHGALVIVTEPELCIRQYSANLSALLGVADQAWQGHTLARLLGEETCQAVRQALLDNDLAQTYLHLLTFNSPGHADSDIHLFGNRMDGLLILELEPTRPAPDSETAGAIHALHNALPLLKRAGRLEEFLQQACDLVKACTGFERVMVYRFLADGSGHVMAETRESGLESYLHLHYPASDIPEPARRLFQFRTVRFLPNADYEPVPLLPPFRQAGFEHPVDLSFSTLRSVSLMYSVYLRNMGVKSTLVMPLLVNRTLWGLISCMHHSAPRYLTYPERVPAELLAGVITQWLREYQDSDYDDYRNRLRQTLARQTERATRQISLHFSADAAARLDLLETLNADGVAIIMEGQVILQGDTPAEPQVRHLADWLSQQNHTLYVTDRLAADYPPAAEFGEISAGVLAMVLPKASENALFWFRREYPQDVHWAGNPDKPVEVQGEGALRELHPRNSFALWKQVSRGRSKNWLACEIEYAGDLRQALTDLILQRIKLAGDLNPEGEIRQQEMDSFFYSAAHDLREPLIGIRSYLQLIQMEDGQSLSDRNVKRMDSLVELTYRMEETLKSLMWFTNTGKNVMDIKPHDMGELVREVAGMVMLAYPKLDIRIEIQADFPETRCDEVKVKAIYQNLIRNAAKYNDHTARRIEIGYYLNHAIPVFFVRDNGIGIATEHHADIFELFRRLHGSEAYGGGSGAGLTIVRKAVERHGGRIWLDSTPGQGTTFFFTLTPSSTQDRPS